MTDAAAFPGDAVPRTAELRHELRTPINHIIGYAEMLLEDLEGDESQAHLLLDTISEARGIIELIDRELPRDSDSVGETSLENLFEALRGPQGQIIAYVSSLISDGGAHNEEAVDDFRKILKAARRIGELDISKMEHTAERIAATQDSVSDTQKGEATTGRILVVDDVEENRDMLERRLNRAGYSSASVENGRRALEALEDGSFDLVLLDVLMPEMDGYTVLERIKENPELSHIPIIMISAMDDMPSIVRCIERGAEDYLPKPFSPVLLRARIASSLEKKRLRDQEKEYLRQVGRVIEAAVAVEGNTYEAGSLGAISKRGDELGRLARVFDGMATEVRAREGRLQNQVADLRKEISAARSTSATQTLKAAENDPLKAGERFAERYEIKHLVGTGGMGAVYLARDLDLDEEVAIKTLRSDFLATAESIDRFKREIKLARRISHRNVVRTHDFGDWKELFFLTMEYVEGITVRELLNQRGSLEVSSTIAIGRQLADSLKVAHDMDVIHRDIKPQNLLVDTDGVLKVMDFGVARLAQGSPGTTEVGMLLGTPLYMPPEQLLSEDVDARVDLYATGVVLYECLTGRLPHTGATPVQLVAQVLHKAPTPPDEINRSVSPALSQLVMDLLAKDPDDRVPDAAVLLERLGALA